MKLSLLKLLVREIAQTVSRGTTSGPQDTRHDLGYGKTFNDKHRHRQSSSNFPYVDPDPYEDLEYTDQEMKQSASVANKTYTAKTMDPGDAAKTDSSHFVGGNTSIPGGGGRSSINNSYQRERSFYFSDKNIKLSDCFNKVDYILSEVDVAGDSMAPLPGVWQNAPSGVGAASSNVSLKTGTAGGTKNGWSKPHSKVVLAAEYEESDGIMSVWDILKDRRIKQGLE
jgi:hypothetical protein